MQPDKNKETTETGKDQQENDAANPTSNGNTQSAEDNSAALKTAEEDIAADPDLSIHSPNDDLDEGETARLGEDKTDII